MKTSLKRLLSLTLCLALLPARAQADDRWNVINPGGVTGTTIASQAAIYIGRPYCFSDNHTERTGYGSTMKFDCSGLDNMK